MFPSYDDVGLEAEASFWDYIGQTIKVESPNGRLITVMLSEIEKGFARICKVGWKQYEERR